MRVTSNSTDLLNRVFPELDEDGNGDDGPKEPLERIMDTFDLDLSVQMARASSISLAVLFGLPTSALLPVLWWFSLKLALLLILASVLLRAGATFSQSNLWTYRYCRGEKNFTTLVCLKSTPGKCAQNTSH